MGANAVSPGQVVTIDQLNALYNRLYTLYNTHKTSSAQLNTTFKNAAIPISNTSGHARGSQVNVTTELTDLKNALNSLSSSQWYQSNTANTITTMTDYSGFTLPSVGDLLKATDFNTVETAITNAEKIIPSYSSQYSNYSNYTNYNNYSNYSNYSKYSNYSNYSKYSKYSNYSRYSRSSNANSRSGL